MALYKNARLFTLKKGSFNSSKNIFGGLINQSFFKLANLRKPEILILRKVCQKSKMLMGFGILVMRRFMTQSGKTDRWVKSGLTLTTTIVRMSQKRMIYDTLFL
jgi:hypothetical protein